MKKKGDLLCFHKANVTTFKMKKSQKENRKKGEFIPDGLVALTMPFKLPI